MATATKKTATKKTATPARADKAGGKKTATKKVAAPKPARRSTGAGGKETTGLSVTVYDRAGKKSGTVNLPESVFGLPWNGDLVHQVVVSMQGNARTPVAHTKDRSEVRGGGKKPWRQKGTGRARHGSSRSPIWVGGGVTFGPRNERDYGRKVNRKMRVKALYTVLSQKLKDGEVIFVSDLAIAEPKTKDAQAALTALSGVKGNEGLSKKKHNAALVLLSEKDIATAKSFRNLSSVMVDELRNINPVRALQYKYLVITGPEKAVEFFENKAKTK